MGSQHGIPNTIPRGDPPRMGAPHAIPPRMGIPRGIPQANVPQGISQGTPKGGGHGVAQNPLGCHTSF